MLKAIKRLFAAFKSLSKTKKVSSVIVELSSAYHYHLTNSTGALRSILEIITCHDFNPVATGYLLMPRVGFQNDVNIKYADSVFWFDVDTGLIQNVEPIDKTALGWRADGKRFPYKTPRLGVFWRKPNTLETDIITKMLAFYGDYKGRDSIQACWDKHFKPIFVKQIDIIDEATATTLKLADIDDAKLHKSYATFLELKESVRRSTVDVTFVKMGSVDPIKPHHDIDKIAEILDKDLPDLDPKP